MLTNQRLLFFAAMAVTATLGDFMMLAVTDAAQPSADVLLALGGALGVIAIPLYALGYRVLADVGVASSARRIVIVCGAILGPVGGFIHGLSAFMIQSEVSAGVPISTPLEITMGAGSLLIGCWVVATIATVVANAAIIAAALSSRSALPRALAVCNPIVGTVVLVAIGMATPWGRAYLAPAAPNLAHIALFAVAAASMRSSDNQASV